MLKPRKFTSEFREEKACRLGAGIGSVEGTVESETTEIESRTVRPIVLPETFLLFFICLADMLQTVYVVKSGLAIEANPVLSSAMNYSPWAFISLKSVTFLAPLGAVELLRPRNPAFIRMALRLGASGYLLVYLFGTLHINNMFHLLRIR